VRREMMMMMMMMKRGSGEGVWAREFSVWIGMMGGEEGMRERLVM